jgi:hypothetical protein
MEILAEFRAYNNLTRIKNISAKDIENILLINSHLNKPIKKRDEFSKEANQS